MKHVLIIEDDADIRTMLQVVLEFSGFRVSLAKHGKDGLEQLAAGLRPDVIVLDLMMPVLSGWEFRERQLADSSIAGIPVVVVSGGSPIPEQLAALGGIRFIEKPVDLDRLVGEVRKALKPSQV